MPSPALDQQPCPVAAMRFRKEIISLHQILQDYLRTLKTIKVSALKITTIDDLTKQIKYLKEFHFTVDSGILNESDVQGKHIWLERKARAIELLSILLQHLLLFDSTRANRETFQAKNRLKAIISAKIKAGHNLSRQEHTKPQARQEHTTLQKMQSTITAIENLQKKYNSSDKKKINFSVATKVFLIESKFKKYINEVTDKAVKVQAAEHNRLTMQSQKPIFISACFYQYRRKATKINTAESINALFKALSLHRYPLYNCNEIPHAASAYKSLALLEFVHYQPTELLASPLVTSPQLHHNNKYLQKKMSYIRRQCLNPTITVNLSHTEKVFRLIEDRINFHREQRGCYGLFNRLLNHYQKAKKLSLILNAIAAANTDRLSFSQIIDIEVVITWHNKSVSISLSQALNENRLGLFFSKQKTNGAKYIEQKTRDPATLTAFVNPCFTKE